MASNENHIFHPNMKGKLLKFISGKGLIIKDSENKSYIDASGGPITCTLGIGESEIIEAMHEQALKMCFAARTFAITPILESMSSKLCELTNFSMDRVFLMTGGSEANELAMQIARVYHMASKQPSKYIVIGRWNSFHGSTLAALSIGGYVQRRSAYEPYLLKFPHIPPAYCYRCWYNQNPETCHLECANALEQEILMQGPENIAAFIVESISGTSLCGVVPHKDYFKRIHAICDKYDVLLIMDEVMMGFGRTGTWFAYEHFGIIPDILTLGKGLTGGYFPASATLCSKKIYDKISDNWGKIPGMGHTWSQNPLGAAVILKTIEFIQKNQLINRSKIMGEYLFDQMKKLLDHPTVGDIRGKGLLLGIEFVKNKTTKEPIEPLSSLPTWESKTKNFASQIKEEAQNDGLLLLAFSGNIPGSDNGDMIFLGPYFGVTRLEIDQIVEILDRVISRVEKKHGFIK